MSVEGWKDSSLISLLTILKSGGTPNTSRSDFYNGDIPFVAIEDMSASRKYLYSTVKSLTKEGLKNSNAWLVPENSLLYSIYATLGLVRINKIPVATNQAILAMIVNDEVVDQDYLYYWLEYIRDSIVNLSAQTTQSNLSATTVKPFLVQHPKDKEEQTQIATILSTIDRAIEQTETLIAKQQRIKTGLMQDLLTKGIDENGNIRSEETHQFKDSVLGRIPVEWEVKPLGEKARVRSGSTPLRSNEKFWIGGTVSWVKTSEVCFSKITETEEKITEQALKLTSLNLEPIGSVLVAMYGQGGTRGRCAILGIEATTNQACAAILGQQGEINQDYLFYYLSSKYNDLRTIGHGSNQTNLNGNLLRLFLIKVPSYKEQVKIADSFNKLKQMQDQLFSELSKLNSIKTGLMQDLLTGKVRVTELLKETD